MRLGGLTEDNRARISLDFRRFVSTNICLELLRCSEFRAILLSPSLSREGEPRVPVDCHTGR